MRVFISEYLVGGACADIESSASMRHEGLAMLQAVVSDISRLPGFSCVTTLENGVSGELTCDVIRIRSTDHENEVFQGLLNQVDAVLVIAPETGGVLANRCWQIRSAGVISWNCSPESIELCGDKLRFAEHLQSDGLATIPTAITDLTIRQREWPLVLKPRDGAGSNLTFLVRNQTEWEHAVLSFRDANQVQNCLMQPFNSGRTLSIGMNLSFDGDRIECLPIGEQILSDDGRFHYLGGRIPAGIPPESIQAINDLALATCRSIPGLAGYVGIDLILKHDGTPVVVELNPRLTTSYVGYRQLFSDLLPSRWISGSEEFTSQKCSSIEWSI